MSIRTIRISRNLSKDDGKPNRRPLSHVLEIYDGDVIDYHNSLPGESAIYYFKTADLTDKQVLDINKAIASPLFDMKTGLTIYPAKTVTLDCFSSQEKTDLAKRGSITSGKGGTIQNSNFIIAEV